MDGFISKIQRFSTTSGPGLRSTVMAVGCPMDCSFCCTPHLRGNVLKFMRHPNRCIGCGECVAQPGGVSPCLYEVYAGLGEKLTDKELAARLLPDKAYYDYSGGGVTFSGGDAGMQAEFFCATAKILRKSKVRTALETSGYFPWDYFRPLAEAVDLVMLDIKFFDTLLHERYTGAGNQLVFENAQRIAGMGKDMIARMILIPGINDSREEIRGRLSFVESLGEKVKVQFVKYCRPDVNDCAGRYLSEALADTPDCSSELEKYAQDIAARMNIKIAQDGPS